MAEKTTFIKLDRNILQWRWYKDANVFRVFIYLLITAAYKATEKNGITLQRGQCLTTYKELASVNGISLKAIRTAVTKLNDTGEITIERKVRKLLITVTKYELYQGHGNLTFFGDMRSEGIYFDEKGHLLSAKKAFTKNAEKRLEILQNSELQQAAGAITLDEKGIYFGEKGHLKEESIQRRNIMYNYFNNNKKNNILLPTRESINYIITIFNNICTDYPRVRELSEPMIEELSRSLEVYSLERFREVFERAQSTPYLKGVNKHKMRAKFEWLINAENMAKILNGNYDDPPQRNDGSFDTNGFFEASLKKAYENIGGKKYE